MWNELEPSPLSHCPARSFAGTADVEDSRQSQLSYLPALVHLLCLGSLSLSLTFSPGVDPGSKGVLEFERNLVHDKHDKSQRKARWLAQPYRTAKEAHGASIVHWSVRYVEREACNHVVHKDAKIITQISAGNAESPHGREDKNVAAGEKCDGKSVSKRCL